MRNLILSSSSAILYVLSANSALAQANEARPAEQSVDTAEIIVTAQRRSESIQRVPVSLTAVTADTLKSQQINDLTQITRVAPSLQIGQDSSFAVRGVGTLSFSGTIDSSVALAIDDVNYGRPLLNAAKFLDLERVEVLNGPQGLLFGKNASAGLLNVVTTRPKIGVYSSSTDIEYASRETPGGAGNANGIIVRETLNIPISSIAALRITGLYSYEQPPVSYVGKAAVGVRNDIDRRSYSIKGKLLVEPSEALSLYMIADFSKLSGVGGIFSSTYRSLSPTSTNIPAATADGITAGPGNFQFGGDGGYWRDIKTGGAQASVRYEFDSGVEISNLFAWRYYDQDQQIDVDYLSANGANTNHTVANYNQYSNELRLALPANDRLTGQAGIYAFKSTLNYDNLLGGNNYVPAFVARTFPFCVGATVTAGPPPACGVSNLFFLGSDRVYTLDTKSLGGFGQLTFSVTDGFKLIAGGRVTYDKIGLNLLQGRNRYFVRLGGPSGRVIQEYSNTNFSWKLGSQYQLTSDIMAYGFYGRGYKGPGFNDQAVTLTGSLVIRPETSNTLEAGIKTAFFDHHLTFNISAFTTKFSDFQVQSFDTNVQTFIVQNAASVRSMGIETALTILPFQGFSINAGASLLSSRFVSFPGAQCYPTQTTRGCSATVQVFDAGGLRLPVSPKFTSTVQFGYNLPASGSVVPFLQANWYHRSSVNYVVNQAPGATVGAIDTFGATVGAKLGDHARVSIFCKNCTNQYVPTSILTDSGDASATPKRLSYAQTFNLDSVRSIGAALNMTF